MGGFHGFGRGGLTPASKAHYDNTASEIDAHTVQDAIDFIIASGAVDGNTGFDNPMTAEGDLIRGATASTTNRALTASGATATGTPADTGNIPNYAMDGNGATYWQPGSAHGTITIDLGAAYLIEQFRIVFYGATNNWSHYRLESSPDNATWTTRKTVGPLATAVDTGMITLDSSELCRYYRFVGLATTVNPAALYTIELHTGIFAGDPSRLARGSAGQVLTAGSAQVSWENLVQTGLYASKPAAGVSDRLYLPTNSAYILRDNASAWKAFGPIFPMTPPVLGDFTWVNQDDATAVTTRGFLEFAMPAEGAVSNSLRMLVMTAPATPYTVTIALHTHLRNSQYVAGGFCWRDSASGKVQAAVYRPYNNDLGLSNWDNPTTINGEQSAITVPHSHPLYLRISDDGTDRAVWVSDNPYTFVKMLTVTRTTFITPDQIGLLLNSASTTYGAAISVYSWEIA